MFEFTDLIRGFTGLTIITMVFLIAGAVLIRDNRTVSREARFAFLGTIAALGIIVIADWFTYITNGTHPELALIHTLLMSFSFAAAPFLPVVIANTIFPDRHAKWVMVIMVIHAVIQVVNIPLGFIFWVDADNVYHRGPLYVVYMSSYIISALYLAIESIRAARTYQTVSVATVFFILICMVVGVGIQIIDADVRTSWPSVGMAVILYFMFYSDMILRSDPLTKLLNRHSYEEMLAKPPLPCVGVVLDINDFKGVNDTYGHGYGDECLSNVAQMIRKSFGGAGLCYRTGGDEFVVVMTKRLADADVIAAEFQGLVAKAQREDPRMPGVSLGYSAASADCDDVSAVFQAADKSMYDMKQQAHQAHQGSRAR